MTHSDTFAAVRRKVPWALRGGTTAESDDAIRSHQFSRVTPFADGLECGVCERLHGWLAFEVVPSHHGGEAQPCPLKSLRWRKCRAPILFAYADAR